MASKTASRLKEGWMEMPADCFEPLTFGELKVGQKFIALPLHGDNSGHGGFRGPYYIFTKTHQQIIKAGDGLRYDTHHGRAVNNRGISSNFPDSMYVVLIE